MPGTKIPSNDVPQARKRFYVPVSENIYILNCRYRKIPLLRYYIPFFFIGAACDAPIFTTKSYTILEKYLSRAHRDDLGIVDDERRRASLPLRKTEYKTALTKRFPSIRYMKWWLHRCDIDEEMMKTMKKKEEEWTMLGCAGCYKHYGRSHSSHFL